jgi:hypothetical protein
VSPARNPRPAALRRHLGLTVAAVALVAGCASAPPAAPGSPSGPPDDDARSPVPDRQEEAAPDGERGVGLRELCRQSVEEDAAVDRSRQVLEETFCGATLWVDGLFGGQGDAAAARRTSGRVELSTLYRDFDGFDADARLDLRYDLPTLERRVNLFLGRGHGSGIVEDREEHSTLRSAVSELDAAREWIGGLGVQVPDWAGDGEFRVGVRRATSPEVFAQGRWRQDLAPGPRSTWRLHETLFWRNREGFGLTLGADFHRSLSPPLLFHWSGIATLSEGSEGVVWRNAGLLYRNLGSRRAIAAEIFALGATSAEVPVRDYGARAIYRHPLGRPYLFGEFVVGYSWPRDELAQRRRGYPMFGIGLELLFGSRWWGLTGPVGSTGPAPGG